MIEENYSGILYGRMQQTIKNLDESLKEIYYVNTRTAWDTDIRNNAKDYSRTGNETSLEKMAGLLREHSREYKDINSLYFVFPDKKMAVTSEEFPVTSRGFQKNISRNWKKYRSWIPFRFLWNLRSMKAAAFFL